MSGEDRARDAYKRAERLAAETGIPDKARVAFSNAKNLAALSALSYRSQRSEAGAEALSFALENIWIASIEVLSPLAKYGETFRDAPKKPRVDALGKLILAALNELGRKAPEEAVFKHVVAHGDGVIDEIEYDTIYWRAPGGRDRSLGRARFRNRVSEYRKKLSD